MQTIESLFNSGSTRNKFKFSVRDALKYKQYKTVLSLASSKNLKKFKKIYNLYQNNSKM